MGGGEEGGGETNPSSLAAVGSEFLGEPLPRLCPPFPSPPPSHPPPSPLLFLGRPERPRERGPERGEAPETLDAHHPPLSLSLTPLKPSSF